MKREKKKLDEHGRVIPFSAVPTSCSKFSFHLEKHMMFERGNIVKLEASSVYHPSFLFCYFFSDISHPLCWELVATGQSYMMGIAMSSLLFLWCICFCTALTAATLAALAALLAAVTALFTLSSTLLTSYAFSAARRASWWLDRKLIRCDNTTSDYTKVIFQANEKSNDTIIIESEDIIDTSIKEFTWTTFSTLEWLTATGETGYTLVCVLGMSRIPFCQWPDWVSPLLKVYIPSPCLFPSCQAPS